MQLFLSGINNELKHNVGLKNFAIISYSTLGDFAVVFLFMSAVINKSIRPLLSMFVFLLLRQSVQLLITLPEPEGLLWGDPGFPAFLSNYKTVNDFYFSAYIGINFLSYLYRRSWNNSLINCIGILIVIYQAFIAIVLRTHFTADIYTSLIVAACSFYLTENISKIIDNKFKSNINFPWILTFFAFFYMMFYYAIQYFVSIQVSPICVIKDSLFEWTNGLNTYFNLHRLASDILLISMNTILDGMTLFILILSIWKKDVRPFLMQFMFMLLRQTIQLTIRLPIPEGILWYYPGFPSLFQTYGISSDLFFSGHTGTSLIAAFELSYFNKPWLTGLGFFLFFFEVASVIVLRAHYTADVFTAIFTVLMLRNVGLFLAPKINGYLSLQR